MSRHIEKIVVLYLSQNREALKLAKTHPAVAILDCFKGQTTPGILTHLERHNSIPIHIRANCTDKLQPLDVPINKPLKDEMKRRFRTWYAAEVEKQLNDDIPIEQVKVEMPASIIKNKSAKWMMSAWQALQRQPDVAINGCRKAGIMNAVNTVTNYFFTLTATYNRGHACTKRPYNNLNACVYMVCLPTIIMCKKGTYLCRTDSLLEPLCCKAFSGNATPHQQHWAVSIQMQPSNHPMVIGRQPPDR